MPNYKKDGDDINNLISEFIQNRVTKSKLNFILDGVNQDWEKWLQVELQYYINSFKKYKVRREVPAIVDKRMLKERTKIFIDLVFRKNGSAIDKYFFVELKINKTLRKLYQLMCMDHDKVRAMRLCKIEFRTFWFVGFYLNTDGLGNEVLLQEIKQENWEYIHNEEFKLSKERKIGVLILGHPVRE